jgi:hypothetical protein
MSTGPSRRATARGEQAVRRHLAGRGGGEGGAGAGREGGAGRSEGPAFSFPRLEYLSRYPEQSRRPLACIGRRVHTLGGRQVESSP